MREIDSNGRSTQSLNLDQPTTQTSKEISNIGPKLDLTLKLGHDLIPPTKRRRYGNQPSCQVDGCVADLSVGKDYHRRHKVCERHSKATDAVVARRPQRFCQQCSKFHPLPEFDEGKRSCRWRLAGHNQRRRKPRPEGEKSEDTDNSGSQTADGSSSVALPTGGGEDCRTGDWEIANLLVAMSRGSAPAMRSMKCPSTAAAERL